MNPSLFLLPIGRTSRDPMDSIASGGRSGGRFGGRGGGDGRGGGKAVPRSHVTKVVDSRCCRTAFRRLALSLVSLVSLVSLLLLFCVLELVEGVKDAGDVDVYLIRWNHQCRGRRRRHPPCGVSPLLRIFTKRVCTKRFFTKRVSPLGGAVGVAKGGEPCVVKVPYPLIGVQR